MLQLILTVFVGLATLACTQTFDNNKAVDISSNTIEHDGSNVNVEKRSTSCGASEWHDSKSEVDKRAWNSIQPSWGKRKWQDMQNPGWGKRSPAPDFDKDIQDNLQTSFHEDKRGWKDMQGASWGKRGWQDMRQPSWGKRGWKDMQGASWGKRGWQDMHGNWGKRGWQDMRGNWGKRGWQDMQGLNWGKRRWQDMPTSAWGKRGWKEMQSTGWGKRDGDDPDKRGWGDMKMSGYGKRAWNDIQASGWGKRGWKEMQSTGWGKRSPQEPEEFDLLEEDWEYPVKDGIANENLPSSQWLPLRSLGGPSKTIYEQLEDPVFIEKVLEGLHNASWESRQKPSKPTDEAGIGEERNL